VLEVTDAAPATPMTAASLNVVLRRGILATADSRRVQRFVRSHGMRLGAARFVGGETLDDVVPVLRRLNERSLRANTTLLGEDVRDRTAARMVVDRYEEVFRRLHDEGLDANVALKLTHLGLGLDAELASANVARLVAFADGLGNFVRIDMEESKYVDPTLRIYRRLREAGHDNVGTVLQSYLYRADEDLRSLLPLRPNIRIVKGAYLEPPDVAYPRKADVDAAYARMVEAALAADGFTAIATHDATLIERAAAFADQEGIGRERFEFQMLYGVRPNLQRALVERGFAVRVATPYGPDWYPYLMRRLAERPANVLFFLRSLAQR
jgi:proline dehydrogenase